MNYPAASSEVSPKDGIYFIVASDGVLNPQRCNKSSNSSTGIAGFDVVIGSAFLDAAVSFAETTLIGRDRITRKTKDKANSIRFI